MPPNSFLFAPAIIMPTPEKRFAIITPVRPADTLLKARSHALIARLVLLPLILPQQPNAMMRLLVLMLTQSARRHIFPVLPAIILGQPLLLKERERDVLLDNIHFLVLLLAPNVCLGITRSLFRLRVLFAPPVNTLLLVLAFVLRPLQAPMSQILD